MQIVGTLSAAVVLAPVLILIQKAYGIGVPTAEHPNPLTAPQATLMESVARGVFQGNLPWSMISVGMAVGIAIIVLDQFLKWRGARFRTPILAVAVGIYLPFELSVPIFAGGLIAYLTGRRLALWQKGPEDDEKVATAKRSGLLLAAGLITGEALVGIFMAIPIVNAQDREVLALMDEPFGGWPGVELLVGVGILLYLVVTSSFRRGESES
jgi:putative OPT family oligopeptide transporter